MCGYPYQSLAALRCPVQAPRSPEALLGELLDGFLRHREADVRIVSVRRVSVEELQLLLVVCCHDCPSGGSCNCQKKPLYIENHVKWETVRNAVRRKSSERSKKALLTSILQALNIGTASFMLSSLKVDQAGAEIRQPDESNMAIYLGN